MKIDSGVLKFFTALIIVAFVVELISQFSGKAAYVLVGIIVLGILLNNPIAISLISVGANSLSDEVN